MNYILNLISKISRWIKNNHTWFFSGLGVFILSSVVALIIYVYNNTTFFEVSFWKESIIFNRFKYLIIISISLLITLSVTHFWIKYKIRNYKSQMSELASKDTFQDDLLKVPNRKALNFTFIKKLELAQESNTPISMMYIDIDNFKRFNDSYNYETGDHILKQFIDRIKPNTRENVDDIIRYQGDEFIILSSKTTGKNCKLFAKRLKDLVNDKEFELLESKELVKVTMCASVTEIDYQNDTLKDLIKRLQDLLKKARTESKNVVVLYNDEA